MPGGSRWQICRRATVCNARHSKRWPMAGAWPVNGMSHRRSARGCLMKRSEEHTSELQSLMRISYAVFCLKKKKIQISINQRSNTNTLVTSQLYNVLSIIYRQN